MIRQEYKGFKKMEGDGCFIIAPTKKQLFSELEKYAQKIAKHKKIYYYVFSLRESSWSERYIMEILVKDEEMEYFVIPFQKLKRTA